MAFLFARTALEADLYVDLMCEEEGEVAETRKRKKGQRRNKEFILYQVRCKSGKLIDFEFSDLPTPVVGLRRAVRYGGTPPSQLIDAGQWLMVSDRMAAKAPRSVAGLSEQARKQAKHDMSVAVACIEEVLKFIPSGSDRVSSSSLTSAKGKAYFNKDVRRFQKSMLQAAIEEHTAALRRYDQSRL